MMPRRYARIGLAGFTAAVYSLPADAHIVSSRLGDFFTGALHPLTDPADIMLWIGLALLAGCAGARSARWLVLAVPVGLVSGFVLSLTGVQLPGVLTTAMLVMLGAIAVVAWVPTAGGLVMLALVSGIVRGIANAGGVAPDTDVALYATGLAGVGYAAITLAMALSVRLLGPEARLAAPWRQVAVRVAGSWIAAIGLMTAALAMRG